MLGAMFSSCSEEIKPKPFEASKVFSGENSKTWKLVGFVARKTGSEDFVYDLNSCVKDDRYTFYANDVKLFEVHNGNIACNGDDDDPLLVSYTWSFNNSNASLSMVVPHIFGYFFIPFTVVVVNEDEDEMELEIFINEEGTESYAMYFEVVDED